MRNIEHVVFIELEVYDQHNDYGRGRYHRGGVNQAMAIQAATLSAIHILIISHTDYPTGSGFVPPPPPFQPPRPICEAGNAATVYGPANFYSGSQLGQSSDSYEIEVSFN